MRDSLTLQPRSKPDADTLRLLGEIRLSRETETSTSPERQEETIHGIRQMVQGVLVHICDDLDVSGRVYPQQRPKLGSWFRALDPACETNECSHTPAEPCMGQWDALVAWKMDRITRRALHFHTLMEWMKKYGKAIITSDGVNTTTKAGRQMAEMMAMVASWEWEAIQERNEGAAEKMRQLGRWKGGVVPYGYRAVPSPIHEEGWYLVFEDDTIRHVQTMVNLSEDHSMKDITAYLNENGIVCPSEWRKRNQLIAKGEITPVEAEKRAPGRWNQSSVHVILTNRVLTGESWKDGKPVRGKDGLPVMRAQALMVKAAFEVMQKRFKTRGNVEGVVTKNATDLRDVAYCMNCLAPLYQSNSSRVWKGKTHHYNYFRCSTNNRPGARCHEDAVNMNGHDLKALVEKYFLNEVGSVEAQIRVFVPGNDVGAERERYEMNLKELSEEWDMNLYDYEGGRQEYLGRKKRLMERLKQLETEEIVKPHYEWQPMGKTYGEAWAGMEWNERGNLLRKCGVKVLAWPALGPKAPPRVLLDFPDDMKERLREHVAVSSFTS
ncbi:recombinase family protein [Streptomyces noursei]|uniref:recombinase family protein n=1 Tax=Streptomyces noursei TaxID=1971 RepID=UPI0016780E80|nr:recombinase family protein [Streptomyces noursei]MCZ1019375.1 recombinase family protein [Streptomyces noursei]